MSSARAVALCAIAALVLTASCASVERGRYGVASLRLEGLKALDRRAVAACLVTLERPRVELKLGLRSPTCGKPPFDSSEPTLRLWRWPWTEWPSFNLAVFEQDLERILRFYRARGFYDAAVTEVRYEPPEAAVPGAQGTCHPETQDCTVRVDIVIEEGEPVRVADVEVRGLDPLSPTVADKVREAAVRHRGARFDEATYDASKGAILDLVRGEGYAVAEVRGEVRVDREEHQARVRYDVELGSKFEFGQMTVSGQGELPQAPILAAARVERGRQYDPAVLRDMQADVFALGAFSAVEIHETPALERNAVDLELRVTPLAPHQFKAAIGIQSGVSRRTDTGELTSIPQWDVHLLGSYEKRHVFGTLGKLRIDERPRMIQSQPFPAFTKPDGANTLGLSFNQPGLLEARTDAFIGSVWDYGPDPFLGFRRSDLLVRVGLRRAFFSHQLTATLAVQQDSFFVPSGPDNPTSDGSPTPTSYGYTFVEQDLRCDLRDNRTRPTRGVYAAVRASQAPRWALSDWTAVQLSPEVRGYLPLPWDMVLAARFAMSAIFVLDSSETLDPLSRRLGPTTYRLRGGGATGNRGFLPGQLGVGIQGGLRRWESSLELRIPIGAELGVVGFVDLGDVNDQPAYRFDSLNTSVGFGLRYFTVIGAVRLDVGYRVLRWQRIGGEQEATASQGTLPFSTVPGAVHLTIGESF